MSESDPLAHYLMHESIVLTEVPHLPAVKNQTDTWQEGER